MKQLLDILKKECFILILVNRRVFTAIFHFFKRIFNSRQALIASVFPSFLLRSISVGLIVFFSYCSYGQVKMDSLINELNNAQGETHYNLLLNMFHPSSVGIIDEYYKMRYYSSDISIQFDKASLWSNQFGTKEQILKFEMLYFKYYFNISGTDNIIKIGKRLLDKKDLPPNEYHAIMMRLSNALLAKKAYHEYFDLVQKKAAFRAKHNLKSPVNENSEIAAVYYGMGQYEQARKNYKISLLDSNISDFTKSSLINNIGLSFEKSKMYDSANHYYGMAIEMAENTTLENEHYRKYFIGIIKSNKAQLYDNQELIIQLLKNEIKGGLKFREYFIPMNAYNKLASIFLLKNNAVLALSYLDSASLLRSKITNYKLYEETLQLQIRAFLVLGAFEKAQNTINQQKYLADSLKSARIKTALETSTILYETSNKEKEIQNQKLELLEKEKTINTQSQERKALLYGLFLSFIIILIFVIFYYYLSKAKSKIELQKEDLNKALSQKNLLLKEIHHRIKNNLQIVSGLLHLQSNKTKNNEVKLMMKQGQLRIESMSLIHQMLYQEVDFKTVDFKKYLSVLVQQLGESFENAQKINIHIESDEVLLDIDKAVPLGLITNELINNAYKHAFTEKGGDIELLLTQSGNKIHYEIKDNGKGMPSDFDIKSMGSLGMRLVSMLSQEIKADMKMESQIGTKFTLEFNLIDG